MEILVGGIVAMILGVVGLIVWWPEFWQVLKGTIPILLIIGGVLGIYLGIGDVITSSKKEESQKKPAPLGTPSSP
jgi:CDP-diglyceride synthetase